ncbi:MAG: hypothetical protein EOO01_20225 [Chitinophagaceae bacterium]|nr:MAG: hypothetical protein EOO01_20225 [Chitinophagaceae bacterium]
MKKIYSFTLFLLLMILAGCSKDFLKRYEKRIEGTWELVDIDRVGIGGGGGFAFSEGLFTFGDDGRLEYTNAAGQVYKGSWDIRRDWVSGQCSTDDNGNSDCNDRNVKSLQITAVDFTNQDVRSEYFNEMVFTGTNRFKAYIYSGFSSYVFRFRRR